MKQLVSLTVVLAVILGIAAGFVYLFPPSGLGSAVDSEFGNRFTKSGRAISEEEFLQKQSSLDAATEFAKTGDYAESAEIFEEIARGEGSDEQYTSGQISEARRSTIFKYRITGDPADSLESIKDLQANILDENVRDKHRARSLNTLATAHCWFARDPKVIEAIYGEEPFSLYWKGDPTLAVRDMLLWSHEGIYPTPKAAASLAYWYADQVLKNDYVKEELDAQTRENYIAEAKRYIAEADEFAERDKSIDEKYIDRQRYVGYLYRRAFAVGGLAAIGEVSEQDYEDAYALFWRESDRQNSHNGSGFRPFALILQAKFSQLLGQDDEIAREYLEEAVAQIEADPVPQANEVVDFIADKVYDADGRFSWHAIHSLRGVSEVYDQFVTDVELANQ